VPPTAAAVIFQIALGDLISHGLSPVHRVSVGETAVDIVGGSNECG
jgi:hypothetical protein